MADQAYVEHLIKRRAACTYVLAFMLVWTGRADMSKYTHVGDIGIPDVAIMAVIDAVLALFAVGGGLRKPQTRAALYDETTIQHGRRAFAFGFCVALLMCGGYWIASVCTPIDGEEVARAAIVWSISAALARFASLELRALRDE